MLVEKDALKARCGNRAASVMFAKGTEPFGACDIEDLVGPAAARMLGQIWSAAPVGVPGEPFLIRADTGVQERLLMVQVTKIAIEGELLRLFTFTDAPPEGSVALAGWQENIISLLNWLPFGFEIASTDDQIQFANSTFKALFGYNQDEIENIEDWWRLAYPDPNYRDYARSQWYSSIASARAEDREMTPFDLDVTTADGSMRTIQFRHRTIGSFNVNLYIDVTQERAATRELEALAGTDPLTGILNRRRFFAEVEQAFNDTTHADRPIGLLMMDIDHFKRVNDTFGHRIGDVVLIEFAERCRSVLRPEDQFARLGGEEFATLLVDADACAIKDIGERIRCAVASRSFMAEGHALDLTVSVGGSIRIARESLETTLGRADHALYDAKDAGRNAVLIG